MSALIDLAPAPGTVMNPATAELLPVAQAATDQLAEAREALTELRSQIGAAQAAIDRELVARFDRENRRSARLPDGIKISVPAPFTVEWDGQALWEALRALRPALSDQAIAETVERVTSYKVASAKAAALLRHADPAVREAAARCRTETPVENRRATVSRAA